MDQITASYGRVSSQEQNLNQKAAEQQVSLLKKHNPDQIYFDVEKGGVSDREQLCKLLALMRLGRVKTLIAARLDRLTRNDELYAELKRLLKEHDIKLYLIDLGDVDLNTASGELNLDIRCLLAVHERRELRDRVRRGHRYRRERKAPFGRAPWGYMVKNEQFVKDTRPRVCLLEQRPEPYEHLVHEPDDSSQLVRGLSCADIAQEALALYLELRHPGPVLGALRKKYGIPHKREVAILQEDRERRAEVFSGVYYTEKTRKSVDPTTSEELLLYNAPHSLVEWILNPVLRGHTVYNKYDKAKRTLPPEQWDIQYDTHTQQRYLSEEQFEELRSIIKTNHRRVGTPGATFYLTRLIHCDCCGHPMVLKHSPQYQYYGCRNTAAHCQNRGCVRTEKLDEAIIRRVIERSLQVAGSPAAARIPVLESPEVLALREQITETELLLQRRPTAALKQAYSDMQKELQEFTRNSEHLAFISASAEEILMSPYARNVAFWYSLIRQERELLYDRLVRRVMVRDGAVVSVALHA
ncbi:MAG: recombinase family protein [Stenomitos rutilans HA7619-LM2]|nr:recombinase family protein [Stenomitos rutilans HA7619-LM2]